MKRVAIVGTAPSWKQCPWDDPGLEIWSLNDAWTLNLPRISRWFELHPLDHLHYRKRENRVVYAEDVPHGFYVRPEGHLEWLQEQARTIPVYLQDAPPQGWPVNAQRFPLEAMETMFGTYWASGPSYMVALAIAEGFQEIQIWGIHLETEQEYRDQKSNFEHILGIARGKGIKVVMAEASPVMKHGWKYGYEPKPRPLPAKELLLKTRNDLSLVMQQLAASPRFRSKAAAEDRLRRLRALEQDCIQTISFARGLKPIVAPVIGAR